MFKDKSLLGIYWNIKDFDERLVLSYSQKKQINPLLAKLLLNREITEDYFENFINPNLTTSLPNPFLLSDMDKSIERVIIAIQKNEKIGIIADYDVDGSTSASILYKFLCKYFKNIILKIPNRLLDGYGPNIKIMDQMLDEEVSLLFTLDCGTSANNVIDKDKYNKIDVIVIDHHLSDSKLPKVFSIINPNKIEEIDDFNEMAAVGVTFLFLMALRKKLRERDFFSKTKPEPNLYSFLDLVALGTVCDVVKLTTYNRLFVKLGLDLIKKRKNKGIAKIIDNSNMQYSPTSIDLSYIIGPQLNAASRIDDSSLPSKLLISNDSDQIEKISKKLYLLNEKRKLIEKDIFNQAFLQAEKQINQKYLLVYGKEWHNGVLGIIASKLNNIFFKPTIVISFHGNTGTGSARSINNIDLGQIILLAKNINILEGGGGHKMAAGLKIKYEKINDFKKYLDEKFELFSENLFYKLEFFDSILSVNEINNDLLEILEKIEPYGSGNPEPNFIIKDISIDHVKVIKDKHLLIFFKNDFSTNFRAICFNCIDTILGDHLLNFKNKNFNFSCNIQKDHFRESLQPKIIIKDAMLIN